MLKNKFKIITLFMVIILSLSVPIVRAENETTENTGAPVTTSENPDSSNNQDNSQEATNVSDENFKKGDVYLAGDNITIDYIVDGNLFVTANSVTINSQIGGDAFICANSVTIGEQGYVFSNLFTVSGTVDIKGVVYDLYAYSKNVTISGYVYRDIKVGSETLNIFGTVGRNAFVSSSSINFTKNANLNNPEDQATVESQGLINGNLDYSAKNEISFPEGVISGETHFNQTSSFNADGIQEKLLSLGTIIATAIIIWLLCLWLAPKFLKNTNNLITKQPLPVIGLGIITPIVITIIFIIALLLGITATFGLLSFTLLFILIGISTSIFIITMNNLVCNKLKIEKNLGIFGMLIVSSIILWLIGLIPYIGSIVGFIAVIIGLGIIVSNLVLKNSNIKTEKVKKAKEPKKVKESKETK